MKFNLIASKKEQKSLIKFNKSFKTPDPIPQAGIEQAIMLMQI
jgi:hypothetical protein